MSDYFNGLIHTITAIVAIDNRAEHKHEKSVNGKSLHNRNHETNDSISNNSILELAFFEIFCQNVVFFAKWCDGISSNFTVCTSVKKFPSKLMKAPDMQNFAVVLQNMIDRNAPQDLTPGYRDHGEKQHGCWKL